eukprot:4550697-Prorocentrum_lima.AAC.1
MTSSLVGSEMCIRDRRKTTDQIISLIHYKSRVADAGGGLAGGRKQGLPAVSYTHLTLPTICSV